MAVTLGYKFLLVAILVILAVLLLGVLLGLGLSAVVAALVLRMSAKWKFALLVAGAILLFFALFGVLF